MNSLYVRETFTIRSCRRQTSLDCLVVTVFCSGQSLSGAQWSLQYRHLASRWCDRLGSVHLNEQLRTAEIHTVDYALTSPFVTKIVSLRWPLTKAES